MTWTEWLAGTSIALAVRDSLPVTAVLSAVHLLGFTLVTGGAFVANLRMMGVLLRDHAVIVVTRPAGRGVAIGLVISVITGSLLFAPRAVDASANATFQLKMSLLAAAALFHFTVHRAVAMRPATGRLATTAVGAVGLLLWTGVALAGCAYILLE